MIANPALQESTVTSNKESNPLEIVSKDSSVLMELLQLLQILKLLIVTDIQFTVHVQLVTIAL
jgi:hypothetical protein